MARSAQPTGKRGRQPVFCDAAVRTCLSIKVLFGLALRQTTGFVEGLIGPDGDVPDFRTLSRRQKTLAVNIPHRGSRGPLQLLIERPVAEFQVRVAVLNGCSALGMPVTEVAG